MRGYSDSECRRAENRILRDLDRIELPPAEPESQAGTMVGLVLLIGFLVAVCCMVPGCGTISGLGADLQAAADGVRSEMAGNNRE